VGTYFSVDAAFWSDADVIDNFTPEDKYFYLYLLTSPHGNISGCFEVSLKQIADEMGYTKDTVERLIERFVEYHRMIDYDPQTKEILIHKWGKHHWTRSDKYLVALRKKIDSIKSEKFKIYLDALYQRYSGEEKDMVWIPYQYGMDTSFLSFPFNYSFPYKDIEEDNRGVGEEEERPVAKKVGVQEIVDMYNEICVSFPKVRAVSDARKKAIRARMNTYSVDDFKRLFENAEKSDFLKGKNERNWMANFDWLICDSNMAKTLDGNYDNRGEQSGRNGGNQGSNGETPKPRWRIDADVG